MDPNRYIPGYIPYNPYSGTTPEGMAHLRQWGQPMQQAPAQPMQNQPMQQAPMQMQQMPEQNRIWVNGIVGARAYLIANGASVDLWDSTAPYIYTESKDMNGRPSERIYKYEDVTDVVENKSTNESGKPMQFVTREEFDSLAAELAETRRILANVMKPVENKEENHAE